MRTTWMRSMKWLCTVAVSALLFFISPFSAIAFAATRHGYQLSSAAGVDGYFDPTHLVPVAVTIRNSGAAVTGYLSVRLPQSAAANAVMDGTLEFPVHLAARKTTQVMEVLPGTAVSDNATLRLVVHNRVVASNQLSGNSLGRVALVAVVSNSLQAAQFLAGSSDPVHKEPVLAERIAPTEVPTSADWLADIMAVTVTPTVLEQLTTAQTRTLQAWVQLGGLLIVTGAAPSLPEWGVNLPLKATVQHSESDEPLLNYTGTYSTIGTGTIKSTAAKIQNLSETQVWSGTQDAPLIVGRPYGRGEIIQTAFSPLSPELLSWPGNASLWSNILGQGLQNSVNSLPALTGSSGALSLTNSSDALSPMRVPALRFWGPLFLAYVIGIGPVLFLSLRKYRREPMAWVILPIVSIVTTVAIYGFGAVQRPQGVLAETVGMVELTGNGAAEVFGATGFTSPFVTFAHLSTNSTSFVLPMSPAQTLQNSGQAVGYMTSDSAVNFNGVGRWNLRYLYSQGTVSGNGQMEADLTETPGGIYGVLTNDTPFHLHDVGVLWQGKLVNAGDLDPGETVTISTNSKYQIVRGNWLAEYGQYNGDITHGLGRFIGSYLASTDSVTRVPDNRAMIVATTNDSQSVIKGLAQITTAQRIISNERLVFLRQYAVVQIEQPPAEKPTPRLSVSRLRQAEP